MKSKYIVTDERYKMIRELGEAGIPIDEEDWGSERQVDSQNAFCEELEKVLTPLAWAKFSHYAEKATTKEMITQGLHVLEHTKADSTYDGPIGYYLPYDYLKHCFPEALDDLE